MNHILMCFLLFGGNVEDLTIIGHRILQLLKFCGTPGIFLIVKNILGNLTIMYILSLRKKKSGHKEMRSWVRNWSCKILWHSHSGFWLLGFVCFAFIPSFSWTENMFYLEVLSWWHDFWVHKEEKYGGQNGSFRRKACLLIRGTG